MMASRWLGGRGACLDAWPPSDTVLSWPCPTSSTPTWTADSCTLSVIYCSSSISLPFYSARKAIMLVLPSTKDHSFQNEQSNLKYNVPVSFATLNLSLVPPVSLCLSICLSPPPTIHPSPGLGYHKDLQTRATFMEVLTKIQTC